jgi:hypothetical protein
VEKEPLELSLAVRNNDVIANNVVLFGANFFKTLPLLITVQPLNNVSYLRVLRDSATHPFTVGQIRVLSNNVNQVQQNMLIDTTNIYGNRRQVPILMEDQVSEYQFQPTIARSKQQFDITGNVGVILNVLPLTRLVLTITIKKIIRMPTRFDSSIIKNYPIFDGFKPIIIS